MRHGDVRNAVHDDPRIHAARRRGAGLDLRLVPALRAGDQVGIRGEGERARWLPVPARHLVRHVAVDDDAGAQVREEIAAFPACEVARDRGGLADTGVALEREDIDSSRSRGA